MVVLLGSFWTVEPLIPLRFQFTMAMSFSKVRVFTQSARDDGSCREHTDNGLSKEISFQIMSFKKIFKIYAYLKPLHGFTHALSDCSVNST